MRESIKVIKFCSIISLIFLLLTYAVTVNFEGHFVSIDSVWISNNFLITIFGGVFASTIVVLLCEIQKYISAKTNTERYLFYQSLYLYQVLMQMKINIEDYITHHEWEISKNLFDESIRMIQCEMNALQMTDYATFEHGDNSLMLKHIRFCRESLPKMQKVLQSGNKLTIAINTVKIENIENSQESHLSKQITSKNPVIARVLSEELEIVSTSVILIDDYITVLDNCCNQKFKWYEMKAKLVFTHLKGNDIST